MQFGRYSVTANLLDDDTQHKNDAPVRGGAVVSPRVLVALILWPMLCVFAGAWYVKEQLTAIKQDLLLRPPVAILDVNNAVIKKIEANPQGADAAAIAEVYGAGEKLAKAGYIVVPRNNLVAYPSEYEVKP